MDSKLVPLKYMSSVLVLRKFDRYKYKGEAHKKSMTL